MKREKTQRQLLNECLGKIQQMESRRRELLAVLISLLTGALVSIGLVAIGYFIEKGVV